MLPKTKENLKHSSSFFDHHTFSFIYNLHSFKKHAKKETPNNSNNITYSSFEGTSQNFSHLVLFRYHI